jgi:hypothetical protein
MWAGAMEGTLINQTRHSTVRKHGPGDGSCVQPEAAGLSDHSTGQESLGEVSRSDTGSQGAKYDWGQGNSPRHSDTRHRS